jgi:CO dehydrogenase maturation factor
VRRGGVNSVAVKIAIAGKGGSGKTTVAGTMARLAAGRGVDVLAVDADLNPNLALVLGMRPDALDAVTPLPHDLLQHRRRDGETVLRLSLPAEELVLEYGVDCPGKVRLLVMGRPQAGVG